MNQSTLTVQTHNKKHHNKSIKYAPPRICHISPPNKIGSNSQGIRIARLTEAAYGTAKSGVGIASMGVMRPDMIMYLVSWACCQEGMVVVGKFTR